MTLEASEPAPTGDYRKILGSELRTRRRRNPRYSLRAFARDCEMAPSTLSEVLQGRLGLSFAAAGKVARRLGFSLDKAAYFCDLVDAQHARKGEDRALARINAHRYEVMAAFAEIPLDEFRIISDWYHLAIVELSFRDDFVSDPAWIAAQLDVETSCIETALARLLKTGLLIDDQGRLRAAQERRCVRSGVPAVATSEFITQLMMKAVTALWESPKSTRVMRSLLVPTARAELEWVRQRVNEVEAEITAKLTSAPVKDEVYCLSMQFFPVSQGPTSAGDAPKESL